MSNNKTQKNNIEAHFSDEIMTEKYFSDIEWSKKLQELSDKYENAKEKNAKEKNAEEKNKNKNKRVFKEFRDSIGEIINNKLVISDTAKAAFRVGKRGEQFKSRMARLTAPERLYKLEVEESLLEAIKGLISLYEVFPKEIATTDCISEEEKEFLKYLKDRKQKLVENIYHKRDRIQRPEVYTDINDRYTKQKRKK